MLMTISFKRIMGKGSVNITDIHMKDMRVLKVWPRFQFFGFAPTVKFILFNDTFKEDRLTGWYNMIWGMAGIMEGIQACSTADFLWSNLDIHAMAHAAQIIRECLNNDFIAKRFTIRLIASLKLHRPRTDLLDKCLTFWKSVKDSSGWKVWKKRRKKRRKRNHQVSHWRSKNQDSRRRLNDESKWTVILIPRPPVIAELLV